MIEKKRKKSKKNLKIHYAIICFKQFYQKIAQATEWSSQTLHVEYIPYDGDVTCGGCSDSQAKSLKMF